MVNKSADEEWYQQDQNNANIPWDSFLRNTLLLIGIRFITSFFTSSRKQSLQIVLLYSERLDAFVEEPTDSDCGWDTGCWGKHKQQSYHDWCEIDREDGIDTDKDNVVGSVVVDVVETYWCEENSEMYIKEIRTPSCGLMLRDTSHNRNVLLSISRIQQGHGSSRPFGLT